MSTSENIRRSNGGSSSNEIVPWKMVSITSLVVILAVLAILAWLVLMKDTRARTSDLAGRAATADAHTMTSDLLDPTHTSSNVEGIRLFKTVHDMEGATSSSPSLSTPFASRMVQPIQNGGVPFSAIFPNILSDLPLQSCGAGCTVDRRGLVTFSRDEQVTWKNMNLHADGTVWLATDEKALVFTENGPGSFLFLPLLDIGDTSFWNFFTHGGGESDSFSVFTPDGQRRHGSDRLPVECQRKREYHDGAYLGARQ